MYSIVYIEFKSKKFQIKYGMISSPRYNYNATKEFYLYFYVK